MKYSIITLLFLITFLNAETVYSGKCIKSWYLNDSFKIIYTKSTGETVKLSYSTEKLEEFVRNNNKFSYDEENEICVPIENSTSSSNDSLDMLVGILIGFTILFNLIFLVIKVGAK